jgi:hypothetical protein
MSLIRVLSIALVTGGIAACMGYVPGSLSYWDQRVKEMCEKDGGVTVYENVQLTAEEFKRLGGTEAGIALPTEDAKRDFPYFMETTYTNIRDQNPQVLRLETVVKRRSDGKILGRSVYYSRSGGDLPTGVLHGSSYGCPQQLGLSKQIFQVKGR